MTSIRWSQPIDMTLFLGREMWAFPEIKYNIAPLSLSVPRTVRFISRILAEDGKSDPNTSLSLFFQFFSQNSYFLLRTKEKSLSTKANKINYWFLIYPRRIQLIFGGWAVWNWKFGSNPAVHSFVVRGCCEETVDCYTRWLKPKIMSTRWLSVHSVLVSDYWLVSDRLTDRQTITAIFFFRLSECDYEWKSL